MTIKDSALQFEDLLQHSDWVRSLARQLVVDSAQVDDLVQDTWMVALRRPPSHANNLRAWLGRVVTSLAQSTWRSETRRNVREEATARTEALPSTADLVQQASMSRELVDGVLGLTEPFRTVVLMRYFRDMTPTQIARETGRPVPTVKTQLQRGLAKLRERFDETYVDRDSWCTALLPLALAGAPVATSIIGLIPAAAAILGVAVLAGVGVKKMSEPALAPQESFVVAALSPPSQEEEFKAEEGADLQAERAPVAPESGESRVSIGGSDQGLSGDASPQARHAVNLRGRVIDENGDGLNGIELVWSDPSVLQWADESKSVISGPNVWLQIPTEMRSSLKADPEALESFARDHFDRPGLATAFLRGDPIPRIGTTTRAGGEFELAIPEEGNEIELIDEHWGVLGSGVLEEEPNRRAWFAGVRREYIGELVDEELHPVPDTAVVLSSHVPEYMVGALVENEHYLPSDHGALGDDKGLVEFGRIALTPQFSALIHWEGEDLIVPIDLREETLGAEVRFQIQLPPAKTPEITLTGMVYMSDGSPAPRATVVHGQSVTTSDTSGRYQIDLYTLTGDLSAARAGSGVTVMNDVGLAFEGLTGEQPGPDLRLPGKSLVIRGRVLDHRNAPIPGAWVSLIGTIPIPKAGYGLEDLAGGRTMGRFETDADGQFKLPGLLPRDYTIIVTVADQQVEVGPVPAGITGRNVVFDLRE
jgi:RNA polymerase sigma factor (sigma-70 family)